MKPEFTIDDIFGDSLNLKLDKVVEKEMDNFVIEISGQQDTSVKPNKLVKVVKEGIVILDNDFKNKVIKKNLSASMVSSFADCPADWLMNSFILPMIDHEEPIYFARGNMFHKIMEDFFRLPKEERNPKILSQLAMVVIRKDYAAYLNDLETMNWIKEALQGYLETGFTYKDVDVAQIVKNAKKGPELGIEIFVRGKLGNTTRDVVGFVDRVDQMADGSLRVVDYKSGKKIYPFDPNKEIMQNNDFGYWRQQLAYSMLLEQDGHKVGSAVLEFPIARGQVDVDVSNEKLREQVKRDFEATDIAFNKCLEDNLFPFYGHMFCKWCGMLSTDFTPSRYGKLNISWEELNQYVEF